MQQTAGSTLDHALAQHAGMVYLDHNATTPLAPEVMDTMYQHMTTFGNPSSLYALGETARIRLDEARAQVAQLVGAEPDEVIFTGCGSESINMALKGVVAANAEPSHIITSRIEHAAVLETCRYLERLGHAVTYLRVDGSGRVDPDEVRRHLRPTTRLISVMHANNEIGVLQPIEELGRLAHEHGVLFHTDAVQTVGKRPINLAQLPVDLLSLTAHKFYGPKGVGALIVRNGVALTPLIHGGAQESGRRAGTENVLGIIGMGAACQLAAPEVVCPDHRAHRQQLRDRLYDGVMQLDGVRVNGDLAHTVPGTLNVSFRGIKGDAIATGLAFQGIAVSTGSACHASERKPSHVLLALGVPDEWIYGSIRFSLGRHTTIDEIDTTIAAVQQVVRRLRSMLPPARRV